MTRLGNITAAATVLVAAAVFLRGPARAADAPDTTPPSGAVGGVQSPVAHTLELFLYASDSGLGLASAEASLGESANTFVRLGTGSCPEHPTETETIDPLLTADCPETVSGVPLTIDAGSVADGSHELRVRVTDAAGNAATLVDRQVVVRNTTASGGTTIATIPVGVSSGGERDFPGRGRSRPPAEARKAPPTCRAPRLEMKLARRPLWYTPRGVPVLRYLYPYPYRGRLTCLRSGRRVSAPNGTAVKVSYRVWRRSFRRYRGPVRRIRRAAIRVRSGGRLWVRLGFPSGRTIIFRYRSPAGEVARSKLRVAIAPRANRRARGRR